MQQRHLTMPSWSAVALALGASLAVSCGEDDSPATSNKAAASEPVIAAPTTAVTAAPATADVGSAPSNGDTTPATPVIDPGDGGDYQPTIAAADFVDAIDNPYLPLAEGAAWTYEGESDGERERIEIVVTSERKTVMGVTATVVSDRAFTNDELVEETKDWYAQDVEGSVWYLGEDTVEYEDGEPVSTAGSWEAGVDGALPGIVMPARPDVGLAYRQEFLPGEAEDMGEVIRVGERLTTETGSYEDVITTQDWTPLEPEVVEEKSYAPGVGLIRETKVAGADGVVELVAYTPPG